MKIIIKYINGKEIPISVNETDTIMEVKKKIENGFFILKFSGEY